MALDVEAHRLRVFGQRTSYHDRRDGAFHALLSDCRMLALRAGYADSALARRLDYRSVRDAQSTVDVTRAEQEDYTWDSSTYSRSTTVSSTFTSHEEFSLSLDPAAMQDQRTCWRETHDEDWAPPYQGAPGEIPPWG